MLSKKQKQLIASMAQKKQRNHTQLFLAEGEKCVNDFLNENFIAHLVVHTESWTPPSRINPSTALVQVTKEELSKTSLLKTPQNVLALFKQPIFDINNNAIANRLSIALDGIQDPGNMGTIIRLADWFGIENIICSMDTVDWFNPKVVQATMGAMSRIKVHYVELKNYLQTYQASTGHQIYGAFLEGEDLYTSKLSPKGIIVMGNEGNGVRKDVADLVTKKITIPSFSTQQNTSESLNVATATAIICAEFRRSLSYDKTK